MLLDELTLGADSTSTRRVVIRVVRKRTCRMSQLPRRVIAAAAVALRPTGGASDTWPIT
jgi:hypothetical protein